jgi:hypothetical protein
MTRWFLLLVLLLGPLTIVSPAAAAHSDGCDGSLVLGARLQCWAKLAKGQNGGSPVLVTLQDQVPLDDLGPDLRFSDLQSAYTAGPLVVSVPAKRATGPGGTVLMILAKNRLVAKDSLISKLNATTAQQLKNAGVCDDELCDWATTGDVQGQRLLDEGLAKRIDTYDVSTGTQKTTTATGSTANAHNTHSTKAAEPDQNSGGGGSLWLITGGAAAVLLLAVVAVAARRAAVLRTAGGPRPQVGRPRPEAGNPRTETGRQGSSSTPALPAGPGRRGARGPHRSRHRAVPPGPTRTGTVRTDLRPQGYVEIDRCLYRAAWADSDVPPPEPGGSVVIAQGTGEDSDILLAFPPGAAGR